MIDEGSGRWPEEGWKVSLAMDMGELYSISLQSLCILSRSLSLSLPLSQGWVSKLSPFLFSLVLFPFPPPPVFSVFRTPHSAFFTCILSPVPLFVPFLSFFFFFSFPSRERGGTHP